MSTKIKTPDGWKDVASETVSAYFVRKPAWSQAITVTAAEIIAGYAAPGDGIIIGLWVQDTSPATITINDIAAGTSDEVGEHVSICAPVNSGDIVKVTNDIRCILSFVPFEDSAVAEPEVVTPELIRNLHDPDWSQAVAITSEQLLAGYAAPKRGIFVGSVLPVGTSGALHLLLNNKIIGFGYISAQDVREAVTNIPISQGDIIQTDSLSLYDNNYKIYFVPYKAQ